MEIINIGIAGLGTVGSEVAKQLQLNSEFLNRKAGKKLNLVAVSANNKNKNRNFDLSNLKWFTDAALMAEKDEIDLVVELIGGSDGIALDLCKNSLIKGKSVVTANKAMMSKHGYELAKISEKNKCSIAFEASVAGCIPIIKSLRDALSGTRVNSISGILNGTCNFILTEMREKGISFAEVLKDAQEKGYAEADPTFDVDGIDAAQKLTILSAIAFGIVPDNKNLSISGIRDVDVTDILFAEELGYRIKLLAYSKLDNGLVQEVSPCMISLDKQISNVEGVLNAVELETELAGSVLLTGYGAGAEATATAVLSDIISIAQDKQPNVFGTRVSSLQLDVKQGDKDNNRYYMRLNVIDKSGVLASVTEIFKKYGLSIESLLQRGRNPNEEVPVVITTHETDHKTLTSVMKDLSNSKELISKPVCMKII
jgi:homoserine dehydrogenase